MYEEVFFFYWRLIDGKKVMYPLTKIMENVKRNAVGVEIELVLREENGELVKGVKANRVAGMEIFEMAHGVNNEFVFYAYSKDSLNYTALPQYSNTFFNSRKTL